jgi:hypothetical protein
MSGELTAAPRHQLIPAHSHTRGSLLMGIIPNISEMRAQPWASFDLR